MAHDQALDAATESNSDGVEFVPNPQGSSSASLPSVHQNGSVIHQSGQQSAEQLLDAYAPIAADFVARLVSNKRASLTLRFQAACKVLDSTVNKPRGKGEETGGPDLDKLAHALQLRTGREAAIDVRPIPARDDSVIVNSCSPSTRQPDSASGSTQPAAPTGEPDAPA